MLTFFDRDRACNRRDFLRIGTLGLAGLSLPQMLARAAEVKRVVKDRSVVFLFMHGGPSQIETFDPKMSAPEGIRSVTGEIHTSVPGVTFGSTFTKLAAMADKFSIVRSYRGGDANHDIKPIVHKDATLNASLGSLYSRVAGCNNPVTGIPSNVALFPQAVATGVKPPVLNFGNFMSTGLLGSGLAPFVPGGTSTVQQNMQLKVSRDLLDERRQLLARLDQVKRQIDLSGSMDAADKFQQQAFDTILGGVADAFDLSKEDPRTIARYDTDPLVRPDQINKKWNNYNNYCDNARTLGKLMLMSRRLCEAGCGFVTVTTNFVWDMHADVNNAPVGEGMGYMGVPFDHAVSTFIQDVEDRGLSDKILLICTGEMGRTPRVNKNGGRDHWGGLTPLLVYGGGLKMGQVIGQSDKNAGEPASEPYGVSHLVSTIMNALFDVGELRLVRGMPSDVLRVTTTGEPIRELFE